MGTWVEKKGNIILWLLILALVEVLAGTDEIETTVLHKVQSLEQSFPAPELPRNKCSSGITAAMVGGLRMDYHHSVSSENQNPMP